MTQPVKIANLNNLNKFFNEAVGMPTAASPTLTDALACPPELTTALLIDFNRFHSLEPVHAEHETDARKLTDFLVLQKSFKLHNSTLLKAMAATPDLTVSNVRQAITQVLTENTQSRIPSPQEMRKLFINCWNDYQRYLETHVPVVDEEATTRWFDGEPECMFCGKLRIIRKYEYCPYNSTGVHKPVSFANPLTSLPPNSLVWES